MATINGLKIATKGSGHTCPGPTPAMSLVPPTPPAGPVPSPFAYIALSSSASDTSGKLTIAGAETLVVGSAMDVQQPGNIPSQPTGGDIVTHMVNKAAGVFTGQSKVKAGGKDVACTTDKCRLNMPIGRGMVAQTIGQLVTVDTLRAAANPEAYAAKDLAVLDPVSVASGAVIDESVDLLLPGLIPVCWTRSYSSRRAREHTPLGRGGWTHTYHQWVDLRGGEAALYDGGRVVMFVDALPGQTVFDRRSRLELNADRNGIVVVRSLDTLLVRRFEPQGGGRSCLSAIIDMWGNAVRFEYEDERLVRITDTAGRIVALSHDRHGHVIELAVQAHAPESARKGEPPVVYRVNYAYDEDGVLAGVTDATGRTESYSYDGRRRLAQKRMPTGLSFHYRYDDATDRCVRAWGDGGLYTGSLEYDLDAKTARLTENEQPTAYAWRDDGAIVAQTSPDGAAAFAFAFDDDGYQLAVKNGLGNEVRYEYDARGNQTKFVAPGGTEMVFEFSGDRCVRRHHAGMTTEYLYDTRGALSEVRYPSGARITLSYDNQGRIAAVYGASGLLTAFAYDAHHNPIEQRFAGGGVERFRYDAMGNTAEYVDPVGRKLAWTRDALGRVLGVRFPDGTEERVERDAIGRIVMRVDSRGRSWPTAWTGLRAPAEIGFSDGTAWRLAFDRMERPVRIENAKGETFELRYDRAGNVHEMRAFDGRIVRSQRDRAQRPRRVELPDGNWLSYEYDACGSRVLEDSPHGAAALTVSPDGRTFDLLLEDPMGAVLLRTVYDEQWRVVREEQNGRWVGYEYDVEGRCTARMLSTGHVTRYHYDLEGRVVSVEHEGERVEYQHDASGALVGRRFAGCEERRELDAMARVTRQSLTCGSEVLIDRKFHYGLGSELLQVDDARWGRTQYRYDDLDRLVGARGESEESFTYDAAGALTQPGWELLPGGLVARDARATYRYDACSRRIEKREGDAVTEYRWDARNRLREVIRPDGVRVRFLYDAVGRRVRKEVIPPLPADPTGSLPTVRVVEYLWAGETLAAEIDSESGTRVYVTEPRALAPLLVQDVEADVVRAVVTTPIGTASELVAGGRVEWAARRNAYGAIAAVSGEAQGPPFGLLGQYQDQETGLSYVRFRYFDADHGRFLSPDPLELMGGPNHFAFNGAPTMHVDPFGLACILIGDPRTDNFLSYIMNYRVPRSGAYEIYVHGVSNGIWSNTNGMQTPQDLVNRVKVAGNYWGGPIVLNSCNTGRTPMGTGAQVSQAFGTTVYAPNDLVWGQGTGMPNGSIGPAQGMGPRDEYLPGQSKTVVYDSSRPGQWNVFNNGQGHSGNVYQPTNYWTPPTPGGP